jgi:hypothetical protein
MEVKYQARKFNKESYDNNDKYAKDKFIEFIKKIDHVVINKEENYDHDIVTKKDSEIYYFELEVKRNYPFTDSKSYIFDTVSFLGRKKRLHDIKPFIYIILCRETEYCVGCKSEDIFKDEYVENLSIKTRDREGKDQMYRVPKEKCFFFNINRA